MLGRYCRVPPWEMENIPLQWIWRLRLSLDLDGRIQGYQERMARLESPGR